MSNCSLSNPTQNYFNLLIIVVFKQRLGGRKTNFHLNLFLLIANTQTGISLCLGLCSLSSQTTVPSFSLEHRSSLHEFQRFETKSQLFFILPWSWARNQNLFFLLTLFWPITHAPCHFNINLLTFASQGYDVYKHMYKQFAFSCFGKVYLCHSPPISSSQIVYLGAGLFWQVLL